MLTPLKELLERNNGNWREAFKEHLLELSVWSIKRDVHQIWWRFPRLMGSGETMRPATVRPYVFKGDLKEGVEVDEVIL